MASLNPAPAPPTFSQAREQFAAIARLRWRIFVNSLRTLGGRLEMVSWIFMGMGFAILGLGGMFGLGIASWLIVSRNHAEWMAIPFWVVFLYWQLFPLMATAFAESFDASNFLRFPLAYRSYFVVRMVYGALDPTTIIGLLWLAGIAAGIGYAAPGLLPFAALALGVFAAFNVFLSRAVFAWIERWLAQRKTREIFGIIFLLGIISVQFIGQLMGRLAGRHSRPLLIPHVETLLPAERLLPPGLVSWALSRAQGGEILNAVGAVALLFAYTGVFLWLVDVRLRAQYRGEVWTESVAPAATRGRDQKIPAARGLSVLSGPRGALMEKEFRYLSRSGPMLFVLVMPVVILLIFRVGPARAAGAAHSQFAFTDFVFPVGAVYALMLLSGMIYNCFGMDAGGIQFFFLSPLRMRDVMLAKNLAHASVLGGEMALVWTASSLLFHPPPIAIVCATLAGVAFAAIVNFAVGNLLSLYAPRKIDPSVMGRQNASGVSALAMLGVQVVTLGPAGLAIIVGARFGHLWLPALGLLALAAAACAGYAAVLMRLDRIALRRREALYAALCRA